MLVHGGVVLLTRKAVTKAAKQIDEVSRVMSC